jgi:hypothetical protein
MKITRRKFLKTSSSAAAVGAGAVLLPQIASGQQGGRDSVVIGFERVGGFDPFNAIGNFSRADFESLIGTEFNLLSETHGHRTVTLIGVRSPAERKDNLTESFSLVFKGREWENVNQDVYYVTHDTLGYFHALMAPVRESKERADLCYEAVVNRLNA